MALWPRVFTLAVTVASAAWLPSKSKGAALRAHASSLVAQPANSTADPIHALARRTKVGDPHWDGKSLQSDDTFSEDYVKDENNVGAPGIPIIDEVEGGAEYADNFPIDDDHLTPPALKKSIKKAEEAVKQEEEELKKAEEAVQAQEQEVAKEEAEVAAKQKVAVEQNQTVASKQVELEALEKVVEEKKACVEELRKAEEQLAEEKSKLEALNAKIAATEKAIGNENNEISAEQTKLEAMKEETAATAQAISDSKAKIAAAEAKLAAAKGELAEVRSGAAAAAAASTALLPLVFMFTLMH